MTSKSKIDESNNRRWYNAKKKNCIEKTDQLLSMLTEIKNGI